jgi:hypothetical protein
MTGTQITTASRPAPSWDRPAAAPRRGRGLSARQCPRCGAISTHYLTCPSLRLPPGYRLSRGPGQAGV